ncbi:hypothetical protein AMECASPLE_032402 [Ameca splendens]|uniref:Uncharacterized protein n=1 Tax=Ameca splendens TaxID=208324 RepID=A0ABV0XJM0_9TELE
MKISAVHSRPATDIIILEDTKVALEGDIQAWRPHWMFCQEQRHLFMRTKKRVSTISQSSSFVLMPVRVELHSLCFTTFLSCSSVLK